MLRALSVIAATVIVAQTPQRPVFRGGAVLVTVDAYPQQNGRIVEGLKPEDFEVLEDGKPQKVEAFDFVRAEPVRSDDERRDPNSGREGDAQAGDPRNRVFVAFLDGYHVTFAGAHYSRQPLVDGLRRALSPTDLFGVMTQRMRPADVVFGRSLTTLEDQLTRFSDWGELGLSTPRDQADIDLYRALQFDHCGRDRKAMVDKLVARRHEELTLQALEGLVSRLGAIRESRSLVLLFSEGWPLFEPDQALAEEAREKHCQGEDPRNAPPPPLPGVGRGPGGRLVLGDQTNGDIAPQISELLRLAKIDDRRRFKNLLDLAERYNVSFYPVDPGGLRVSPGVQLSTLRTLAENTNGLAIVETNDLLDGVRRVSEDVTAYYLLGYYSTNTKFDGTFRRIQVKMKRPGTTVKARRGYLAPANNMPSAEATAPSTAAASAGPSPIEEALSALARLRSASEIFVYGFPDRGELALIVEMSSTLTSRDPWTKGAEVRVTSAGSSGAAVKGSASIAPSSRSVLIRLPLAAGMTGPWRVGVQIAAAGETLEDHTTLEPAASGVLLSPAVVFRAAPGPRSPLRPVADFQFRRTERAHLEMAMQKLLDQRQARLLSRTGQPLAVAATVTERDPMTLAIDINLAPLGPGDYLIEVLVGAGAETERRLIAIRVVQ